MVMLVVLQGYPGRVIDIVLVVGLVAVHGPRTSKVIGKLLIYRS